MALFNTCFWRSAGPTCTTDFDLWQLAPNWSNVNASILGITESWLDDSVPDSEISIDNFSLLRKDRNRNGGGVALYIKNLFAFNVKSDLMLDNLECVMTEVLLPMTKPILGEVFIIPQTSAVSLKNLHFCVVTITTFQFGKYFNW